MIFIQHDNTSNENQNKSFIRVGPPVKFNNLNRFINRSTRSLSLQTIVLLFVK